jgi:hypothetical protein
MLASYFQQTQYTGDNEVTDLIPGEIYNSVMTFDFNSGKVEVSLDDIEPTKVLTYDKWDTYRKDWKIL